MGYRSQVVLAISKHLTPFLTLATSQNADAQSLVFKYADTFDRDYGGDKSWLLVWDGIKWYESYERPAVDKHNGDTVMGYRSQVVLAIQTIEKFVQEASSDEYQFEIEGVIQASSEHIRFVRVGEETGDVEVQGDGFWDIYPHTNICY